LKALIVLIFATWFAAPDWPAFRGSGDSVAQVKNVPLNWADDQTIAWQVPLGGYGQSSPVVIGKRIFVTGSKGTNKETLLVSCHDRTTGKQLWQHELAAATTVAVSDYVSRAAPTPIADDQRVYAFFESGDLIALDHTGKVQWQRNLVKEFGAYQGNHGIGASPAATNDTLFVLADHEGPSYLLAIDKATGKDRWKNDRPSKVSWSSPIVMPSGPATPETVVISSNGSVEGFDAKSGDLLWSHKGVEGNTVASASYNEKLIVVGSSDKNECIALKRGGKGELSDDDVAWRLQDVTSSFSSPLALQSQVYYVNKAGVAFCVDAESGKTLWTQRLPGSCWVSPVGIEDRIYFFGKDGVTTVVDTAKTFNRLAENRLTIEGRVYGVAVVTGAIILRTGEKLICVGNP